MGKETIGKVKRVGSTAQRLKELPYEKRTCKVETGQPGASWEEGVPTEAEAQKNGMTLEEYVEFLGDVGLEVHIVSGGINRGAPRYRSKILPAHRYVESDPIHRFLELAHEKGIICLSYYPLIFNKQLRAIHPEWLVKILDEPEIKHGNRGWFCLNSPFRDWIIEYLNEWLDNMDLDGFYFDDTNIGSHSDKDLDIPEQPGCHCEYCEGLFREATGIRIPRKADFDSLDFRRYLVWRYKAWEDSIKHIFGGIKEKHPDAILELNYYTRPSTSWVRGHPLNSLGLEEVGGHYFTEAGRSLRDVGYVTKVSRGKGVKFSLLRGGGQGSQSLLEVHQSVAPYPEEWAFSYPGLACITNGATYFANYTLPFLQRDAVKNAFKEFKKRADYLEGETVKYVGLHISLQNRDFRPDQVANNMKFKERDYATSDVYGVYDMLNRSHLMVDFVFDGELTENNLSRYPVVFLSNSACMSEDQAEGIRRYVRNGGTLIATHETSIMDELGRKRGNFSLADVFGVDYSLIPQLRDSRHPWQSGPVKGIIYVPQDDGLKEFGHIICLASEESEVTLRSDSDVGVLCTRSSLKVEDKLNNFRPDMEYDSGEPGVTVNRFGKGTAIYMCADIGGGYVHNPQPNLTRLLSNLVRRVRPPIEIEGPQVIEATAAVRPEGELMVHLLNNPIPFTPPSMDENTIRNYFHPKEIVPVRDIKIKLNDFKVKRARMPLKGIELELSDNKTVTVPEVKFHEIVLIDLIS